MKWRQNTANDRENKKFTRNVNKIAHILWAPAVVGVGLSFVLCRLISLVCCPCCRCCCCSCFVYYYCYHFWILMFCLQFRCFFCRFSIRFKQRRSTPRKHHTTTNCILLLQSYNFTKDLFPLLDIIFLCSSSSCWFCFADFSFVAKTVNRIYMCISGSSSNSTETRTTFFQIEKSNKKTLKINNFSLE